MVLALAAAVDARDAIDALIDGFINKSVMRYADVQWNEVAIKSYGNCIDVCWVNSIPREQDWSIDTMECTAMQRLCGALQRW